MRETLPHFFIRAILKPKHKDIDVTLALMIPVSKFHYHRSDGYDIGSLNSQQHPTPDLSVDNENF